MKKFYVTHKDSHGERHQIGDAFEANTPSSLHIASKTSRWWPDGHYQPPLSLTGGQNMTTWYDATEGVVEAANIAMQEIANNSQYETDEKIDALLRIWQPVATALCDSIREDLDENWPEESALAKTLDVDCVGQTSDTGKIVSWGPDTGNGFRPFHIHQSPEIPQSWRR